MINYKQRNLIEPPIVSHKRLGEVAIDSVKRCGSFSLFWKYIDEVIRKQHASITRAEAKQFEVEYVNEVYRKAQGGKLDIGCGYETSIWSSGGKS